MQESARSQPVDACLCVCSAPKVLQKLLQARWALPVVQALAGSTPIRSAMIEAEGHPALHSVTCASAAAVNGLWCRESQDVCLTFRD